MKAYLIVGNNIELSNIKDLSSSFVVGVDKGAFIALKKGIKLDLAIGDFDSVNEEEFACLFGSVDNIVKLNPIKDVTDTYEAYKHVRDYDEIVILGGIQGRRIEHFLALVNLVKEDSKVKILDNNSYIYSLKGPSTYKIKKSEYKYISFFAEEESIISLKGFKYELKDYVLKVNDSLAISNEIIEEGIISILKGSIPVIQSKEDK